MEIIFDIVSRGVEQLLGRAGGPFHLRLVIMPAMATILATRAGVRDAREGRPPFLWEILTNPAERQSLLHSGWLDTGKMAILGLVLDTIYQLIVLRAFYVVQAVMMVVVLAVVPYSLVRGISTRLTRSLYKKQAGPANLSAANATEDRQGCPKHQDRADV